jgi:hypothetical protein
VQQALAVKVLQAAMAQAAMAAQAAAAGQVLSVLTPLLELAVQGAQVRLQLFLDQS